MSAGAAFLFWLAVTVTLIPQAFSWAGLVFLTPTTYGMFRQSEMYRLPYYKKYNLQDKPWPVRKSLADLGRFQDLLKVEGVYREDITIFVRRAEVALEIGYLGSVWRHPFFLVALRFTANALFQSLNGVGVAVNSVLLAFLVFALIFVLTVVSQIYNVAVGERQLLNRFLLFLITVSDSFEERRPSSEKENNT